MKFVQIRSDVDIHVTCGLDYQDFTDAKAAIPDKLRVGSLWPKTVTFLRKGTNEVPAEIAKWDSVKCLVKDKIITIGAPYEVKDEDVPEEYKEILRNLSEVKDEADGEIVKKSVKTKKSANLNEIAGE